MWETYRDDVDFYVIYIREAHAIDSAVPLGGGNDSEFGAGVNPLMEDPVNLEERKQAAKTCATKLALKPMPMLVDDMQDTANHAYKAGPDRLYLVGKDGRIAYHGGPGPFAFSPDELEEAIRKELGR